MAQRLLRAGQGPNVQNVKTILRKPNPTKQNLKGKRKRGEIKGAH